jgi:hypothetical protein
VACAEHARPQPGLNSKLRRAEIHVETMRLSRSRLLRKFAGCRESEQREHPKRDRNTIRAMVI